MELLTYNQAYEAQVVELWNQELFADPITVRNFDSGVSLTGSPDFF